MTTDIPKSGSNMMVQNIMTYFSTDSLMTLVMMVLRAMMMAHHVASQCDEAIVIKGREG